MLPPSFFSHISTGSSESRDSLPQFITRSVYSAVFSFSANFTVFYARSYEVVIKNKVKGSKGRVEKQQHYFNFSPPFLLLRPVDPWAFGRLASVDFSPQSIHFNHNGQRSEQGGAAC